MKDIWLKHNKFNELRRIRWKNFFTTSVLIFFLANFTLDENELCIARKQKRFPSKFSRNNRVLNIGINIYSIIEINTKSYKWISKTINIVEQSSISFCISTIFFGDWFRRILTKMNVHSFNVFQVMVEEDSLKWSSYAEQFVQFLFHWNEDSPIM